MHEIFCHRSVVTVPRMHGTSELCRVALRGFGHEAELILPLDVPIDEILPSALDLIAADAEVPANSYGQELQLARPGSHPFDGRHPLSEYGVRDGDLLLFVTAPSRHNQPVFDVSSSVRDQVTAATTPWSPERQAQAAGWLVGWLTAVLGVALTYSLLAPRMPRLWWVGIACCLVCLGFCIAIRVRARSVGIGVVLGTAFSLVAGLTAALALPAPSGLPHLMLGMSVCSVCAIGMVRLLDCGTMVLMPLSAVSAATAASSAGALLGWWQGSTIGTILVACSFAMLSAAPRLAARVAGLTPLAPVEVDADESGRRARKALNSLITFAAGAAGLGACMLAMARPAPASLTIVAAITAKLVLHASTHSESYRTVALISAAGITGAALLLIIARFEPSSLPWLCLGSALSVGAAITVLSPVHSSTLSHLTSALEFAVTVAAAPLSCWAVGLPAAIRGASLV
jgi:type VII secretion integral membrane protein EccD